MPTGGAGRGALCLGESRGAGRAGTGGADRGVWIVQHGPRLPRVLRAGAWGRRTAARRRGLSPLPGFERIPGLPSAGHSAPHRPRARPAGRGAGTWRARWQPPVPSRPARGCIRTALTLRLVGADSYSPSLRGEVRRPPELPGEGRPTFSPPPAEAGGRRSPHALSPLARGPARRAPDTRLPAPTDTPASA